MILLLVVVASIGIPMLIGRLLDRRTPQEREADLSEERDREAFAYREWHG